MSAASSVETRLLAYRTQVDAALARYLPDREPRRHLYDLVRSYPLRAGKGLRPSLCIATAAAFGAEDRLATASATAIEMFHNGFLIHDDIEDGSEFRRGQETLHREHGLPLALNAGDAVLVLAMRPIFDNLHQLGPVLTFAIAAEIEHMVLETVEGQAIELGWMRDNDCDLVPEDYLRMCLKKTCWYTVIHPLRIGALIGSGGAIRPERLDRFGYFTGAAFQIQDDLLNLIGERERYGKEIGGDVLEGKRTMMLIHLLSAAGRPEKSWLRDFLAVPRESRTPADVRDVLDLMERHGSIDFGRTHARFLAGAAMSEFEDVYGDLPPGPDRDFIRDIILYMIERDL